MATGFMGNLGKRWVAPHFTGLVILCLSVSGAGAMEVGLAGVLGSKALLMVNGGEPQAVAVGQQIDGIRLVSLQGDQAVIEIDGRKRALRVGQHAQGSVSEQGGGKVTLHADPQGHFHATVSINGATIRFLVDTGATLISIGASDARRLGLDLGRGQRGYSETANGRAPVTRIKLDTVRIGDITLHNVDALVHASEMPVALLGMSFLNRMEMQRDGSTMTLKKRF